MKRFLIFLLGVTILVNTPMCAQTKRDLRAARKDAASALKTISKDGYKPVELGDIKGRLEKYFIKIYSGCAEVVGTADGCITTNLAQITALSNAANLYSIRAGGEVRGRILSSATNLSGQQVDNLVASFERLVEKDIRGELVPFVTTVKEKSGMVSARSYCIVDIDEAMRVRRRAMELALEEQLLADEYGDKVSSWIGEGFAN
jgi:hypothetical protein